MKYTWWSQNDYNVRGYASPMATETTSNDACEDLTSTNTPRAARKMFIGLPKRRKLAHTFP